ncbi:MAG: DUF4190 domain-containing protein [Flavobacteriia bacterium]|jgi:VIT1/CCC1 family predicted Fe2+/Mn2+ transporter
MKKIFIIIILGLAASCTMTKRVHNPGWHVEWRSVAWNTYDLVNQQVSNDDFKAVEQKTVAMDQSIAAIHPNDNSMIQVDQTTEKSEIESQIILKNTTDAIDTERNADEDVSFVKKKQSNQNGSSAEEVDHRVWQPFATASIVVLSAAFLCFFAYFFVFLAPIALYLSAMLLSILAFIFALVARRRIKVNPEKWKGKGATLVVIILGLVFLIGGALSLLIYPSYGDISGGLFSMFSGGEIGFL